MRMTEERAIEINDLLVRAWMIREGIAKSGATVPSLASVSLADAVLASHIVEHLPPAVASRRTAATSRSGSRKFSLLRLTVPGQGGM